MNLLKDNLLLTLSQKVLGNDCAVGTPGKRGFVAPQDLTGEVSAANSPSFPSVPLVVGFVHTGPS